MRVNFYDKSFYLFYCFYKRFGKKELPVLTSAIVLGVTTFLQVAFLLLLSLEIIGLGKAYAKILSSDIVIYCIILFLAVFHILYFYQKKRYYYIILRLRNSREKYHKIFSRYVIINILFLIAIVLFIFNF